MGVQRFMELIRLRMQCVTSGRFREGAQGTWPSPLFWVKERRKAGRAKQNQTNPLSSRSGSITGNWHTRLQVTC